MRSNHLLLDVLGTLPVGHWALGVTYPQALRVLLLPKVMRYLAALPSGRDPEAHLFIGSARRTPRRKNLRARAGLV